MKSLRTDEQQKIADTVRGFMAGNASSDAMAGDGLGRRLWSAFAADPGLVGSGPPEEHGSDDAWLVDLMDEGNMHRSVPHRCALRMQRHAGCTGREAEAGHQVSGTLPNLHLCSRSDTIYGCINRFQHNLISECGPGMPRETRGDL